MKLKDFLQKALEEKYLHKKIKPLEDCNDILSFEVIKILAEDSNDNSSFEISFNGQKFLNAIGDYRRWYTNYCNQPPKELAEKHKGSWKTCYYLNSFDGKMPEIVE